MQDLQSAVQKMRNAQKAYEAFKNGDTIREKRKWEAMVDKLLKAPKQTTGKPKILF